MKNEIRRQETLTQAAKQELLNRGLSPTQVDQVVEGKFVSKIEVVAPPPRDITASATPEHEPAVSQASYVLNDGVKPPIAYEVQSLKKLRAVAQRVSQPT